MDDLKTLRGIRADFSGPNEAGDRGQRERLLVETKRAPGRFDWLRGFRLPSPRLLVPALAAGLTLVLVVGVVIVQGQRNDLTLPGPDQWLYQKVLLVDPSDDVDREEPLERETWRRGDRQALATRDNDGELVPPEPIEESEPVLGYVESLEQLREFYGEALKEPLGALDGLVGKVEDSRCRRFDGATEDGAAFSSVEECRQHFEEPSVRDAWRLFVAYEVLHDGAPPEVQRAFYDTLRQLPTIREHGIVRDEVGRDVVAISGRSVTFLFVDTDEHLQLLFDPDTHLFRGAHFSAESILVLNAGIVGEPGEVP